MPRYGNRHSPGCKSTTDLELIAKDFAERMAGHLPDDKIKEAVDKITTTTTSYPAWGNVIIGWIYVKPYIYINDGKRFDGNGGGIGTGGGGV